MVGITNREEEEHNARLQRINEARNGSSLLKLTYSLPRIRNKIIRILSVKQADPVERAAHGMTDASTPLNT